jgi:hypothetical protein
VVEQVTHPPLSEAPVSLWLACSVQRLQLVRADSMDMARRRVKILSVI